MGYQSLCQRGHWSVSSPPVAVRLCASGFKAGYVADAALDREMAEEWRPVEEETWMRYVAPCEVKGAGDD